MKTNHDGTITLNAYDTWTSCGACGQRVTGDSIHTCSPQLKALTDEEIKFIAYPFESVYTTYDKQTDTDTVHTRFDQLGFAKAILRKAQEK
jgi:succinate dehydrogenase/fumarate reductase-like Fe-S protein